MNIIFNDERKVMVLEKIAKRSKMDTWFCIKNNKVKMADVRTLLHNATAYDLETITPEEMVTVIDIIFMVC